MRCPILSDERGQKLSQYLLDTHSRAAQSITRLWAGKSSARPNHRHFPNSVYRSPAGLYVKKPCYSLLHRKQDHHFIPLPKGLVGRTLSDMRLYTLHELGHEEREVTLIDDPHNQAEHSPHLRGTDIVLVPRPSNDVNDPLHLPQWKKWAAFINVCVLTFMINAWIGGLAPAFFLLSKEFNLSVAESTNLLIWPVLTAGLCVSSIQRASSIPKADSIRRTFFGHRLQNSSDADQSLSWHH